MKLTTFDFNEAPLRAFLDDSGEPWFVAADVCRVLDIQNPTQACQQLDEADLSSTEVRSENATGVVQTRTVNIISEAGLYQLIFVSRKPEAKAFKRWVTKEVLPAIRKTGRFQIEEAEEDEEETPLARAVAALERNADAAEAARQGVLAGTLRPEAAQLVATLCAEVRSSWKDRFKLKPEALPAALTDHLPGLELAEALRRAASRMEGDSTLRLAEIFEDRPLTQDQAKQAGQGLRRWRGHELTDDRGRKFRVRHFRTNRVAAYAFTFDPSPGDNLVSFDQPAV